MSDDPLYENVDVPTIAEPHPPLPPRGAPSPKGAALEISKDRTLYADLDIGAMMRKSGGSAEEPRGERDMYSFPNLAAKKNNAAVCDEVVYATIAIPGNPEPVPSLPKRAYNNFDPANGVVPPGCVEPSAPALPKKTGPREERKPPPALPQSAEGASKSDDSVIAMGQWQHEGSATPVQIRHHHPYITVKNLQTNKVVYTWQTNTLRSFGQQGKTFVFEAGRRSVSGEGKFRFLLDNDVPLALSLRNCQVQK